jgi:hypothetical protein
MAAKVAFGREPAMTPEEINGRLAKLSGSLLTLAAIGCGSLGLWRMCADLGWAGDFVIEDGFLSHWQVWIGAAIGLQYTSWWLARYAGIVQSFELDNLEIENAQSGGGLEPSL